MSLILTLISSHPSHPVTDAHIAAIGQLLPVKSLAWLAPGKAADFEIDAPENTPHIPLQKLRDFCDAHFFDFFVTPGENRRKRLLLADMDATIVEGETLDELAAFAGVKDQVAAITRAAMEGELNFEGALRKRVALLKDLPEQALHQTLARTTLNPGAKTLIATMKKYGATCVLVSGGFTFFTGAVAAQCGFDFHHGNTLGLRDDRLTGAVEGPILDKDAKLAFLKTYAENLNLPLPGAMTIGDGANDLPMLRAAGLGIGYHPKDAVRAELSNVILHGDLTAALYAQGFTAEELVYTA